MDKLNLDSSKVWTEPSFDPAPKDQVLGVFSRRRRLRQKFARLGPKGHAVALHLAMLRGRNILFLKNSKAGCTTIAQTLYFLGSGRWYDGFIHTEQDVLQQARQLWMAQPDILDQPDLFRFTFVRHPTDRILSAFKDFILVQRNLGLNNHKPFLADAGVVLGDASAQNFDRFLDYVDLSLSQFPFQSDRHWRLQTINTGLDFMRYDFIGRTENMRSDLSVVLDQMGVSTEARDKIFSARFNKSSSTSIELSQKQRRRIETLYAPDFEAFSYS